MDNPSAKAISHLLNKSAKNPYEVFGRRDIAESELFLGQFLDQCDLLNFETPDKALVRSLVALELAETGGNPHLRTRALALTGTAFRIEGCFEKAKSIYAKAEKLAKGCPCCLPSLYHRRGVLLHLRESYQESLVYFDKAIQISKEEGDWDGVGRVLISRCTSLNELGFHQAALEDNTQGLELLSRSTPINFFIAGLANMIAITATTIRSTGDTEMIEKALDSVYSYKELLQKRRLKYGFRRVRATMRWTEGLLCGSLPGHDYRYRKRAMQALEIAANNFKDMGLMTEYVLVTADRVRLYLTNTRIDNSRQVMRLASQCLRVLEELERGASDNAIIAKAAQVMKDLERNPEKEVLDGLRELSGFYMPTVDPDLVSVSEAGAFG